MDMTNKTEPLTSSDCDLQDFPFMPLQVARLRDSDLAATEHPEACWYAVLLWAASWHQVPAASLPDDEMVLARLCGLGRDVKTFRKHRAGALRGFVTCSDGRLYHPVVAEQANAAWKEKLAYRDRKEKRASIASNAAKARWQSMPDPDAEAYAMHDASNGDASCMPDAMLKGTGTGTGTNIIVDDEREGAVDIIDLTAELARMAGVGHLAPGRIAQNIDTVREWMSHGASPDEMRGAVQDGVSAASAAIHSLKYFSGAVRQRVAKRENGNGSTGQGSAAEQSADGILRAAAARRAARRVEQQAERA
ncbi:DUF1376 domain-containing protein [Sphingobium sp. Z007]|nr:DUF1376 domain-containing protein [Sphingobium sp. Z007]